MKRIFITLITLCACTAISNNIQAQNGCWKIVSGGRTHTMAIKTDGTLWAWGSNPDGELGDSTTIFRQSPVQIGTGNNWKSVSAGLYYTLALKTDGSLWAWGDNTTGLLGDNSLVDKLFPVQIGTDTNWQSVNAGQEHNLAVKTNGRLWAWGTNNHGQLGMGMEGAAVLVPTQVGSDTDWKMADAGAAHSVALKTNGTLYAWGYNNRGQVGDSTLITHNFPLQISTATWLTINTHLDHSVAIKNDSTLWGWGDNRFGQSGNGTTSFEAVPMRPTIISAGSKWQSVTTGSSHTAAVKNNGTLWSWGDNIFGQLGDGTTQSRLTPVQIGTAVDWQTVDAGDNHTTAITNNAKLYVWGVNTSGQVGNGTSSFTPVKNPFNITCACPVNNWTGSASTAWEDPLNWSCGMVPDANTEVHIEGSLTNYPVISSNAVCKKLYNTSGASVVVNTGFSLSVIGRD